ncbi:DNA-3-methyladenine glycosylase family protein [Radiobacillus deserti]|uniref:DNA-3-methyladenine glycosylase II n=1 Tax=Radiobacillus deserti TaxID=2594883 RepID=A0A516KKI1_9BACI|nr:DNA-3-methyladenine glycosylase [Radiobacillus deserti]QDP41892.1 DNA-3-methyladenine glycosylase 2 family protein [Radiobacillus deserti]
MEWYDYETYIEIIPPNLFSFKECVRFLSRSDSEILHRVKDNSVWKLVQIENEKLLLKVSCPENDVMVEIVNKKTSSSERKKVAEYVWDWLGFNQSLEKFYRIGSNDIVLQPIIPLYKGLRIISIPDLFEAMTWAIIGQQINLAFAYTLKKRFVESYGAFLSIEKETYWIFPSASVVASLNVEDLTKLQFSARKAEYVIGVARAIEKGELSKGSLVDMQEYKSLRAALVSFRGVGTWTADYVMMRCLQHPSAFPIADVGLHNALKKRFNLSQKPSIQEIEEWSKPWEGFEAFATFYLWRYLDE